MKGSFLETGADYAIPMEGPVRSSDRFVDGLCWGVSVGMFMGLLWAPKIWEWLA
jgi:hypothetical protein